MGEHLHALIHKLQFVIAGTLVLGIFFLLALIISTLNANKSQSVDAPSDTLSMGSLSEANAVTSGMVSLADGFLDAAAGAADGVKNGAGALAATVADGGRQVGSGIAAAASASVRDVGAATAFIGNTHTKTTVFVVNVPANVVGSIMNASGMALLVRPASAIEVPIIDPNSPALQNALATLPPRDDTTAPQGDQGPVWPMHGEITTFFGVPHRPYQHTHTGMDISDGQRAGITPVKPFRPGRVIETLWSSKGLGNHVVVDHGNGVTSVYAHLDSIAVQVGAEVGLATTLGLQGTTGVSTGPHLHFEIRVNGEATDPRQFIGGRP